MILAIPNASMCTHKEGLPLKGEMGTALERKRGRAYANAHTTAVVRFQWLRLLLLVEHAPQGECCRSNRPRQLSP